MTDSRAALGSDRLPWLPDEPAPLPTRHPRNDLLAWAVAAVLAIGGGAYWLGMHSGGEADFGNPASNEPSMTVAVPQPLPAPQSQDVQPPPMPEVTPSPVPEVQPVRERSVPIEAPSAQRSPARVLPIERETPAVRDEIERILKEQGVETASAPPSAAPAKATNVSKTATGSNAARAVASEKLKLWPATESSGATGRIVRIGAFGSREQAKLGWRYMVRAYPAIAHLPATVVGSDNSKGRHYYRFQIGTTSQAHSEVLCQRMEKIHFSCAVVGLSWKPRGVER